MTKIPNYINGELRPPADGRYLDNYDPATGQVYSQVADSTDADANAAVAAAKGAFEGWSRTPAVERSAVLLRIADLLEKHLDELARAECIDTGKPLKLARTLDIPRAVSNLRFFGTAILHSHAESHAMDDQAINYTLRRPRGVAGLISPWNLPLYLLTWKTAPALATGNTVVSKPSEITPMTAYLFSKFCIEAGLPPGVLNIVHGLGPKVGAAIVEHDDVKTVSFTGGTATGQIIAKAAAPRFKRLALEMGGKNPNIIFADADFDEAIPGTLRSSFANQGQVCLSGSRVFIEQQRYDEFVDRFVTATRKLKIGDPLEEATDHGAQVSQAQLDKVKYYVELAKEEHGTILCGGGPPETVSERCRGGYFFEPTVITGLDCDCRVNQEEIFGPVVSIMPFAGEDQVVEYANSTQYGLSASIWTQNVSRAHRLADRIESGTVWVNCWMLRDLRVPFGGTKNSGVGREGGAEALRFFTEPKNVCVKM